MKNRVAYKENNVYHIGQLFLKHDLINILDDIIIGGVDDADHEQQLATCLRILRENNLTTKLSNCQFAKHEIQFFDFTISADVWNQHTRSLNPS